MSKPTIIYLVRHGESEANRDGLISGQINPPLTEKGHSQIRNTKKSLSGIKFDAAYSSDLQRAVKSAEIIYGQPIHPSRQIVGLRERNFGSVDGKPEKHIDGMYEKRDALTEEENWHYKHLPDMESDHEVAERFVAELKIIAKNHLGETVLVGAHGTAIKIVIMYLTDMTYKDWPRGSFKNGDYVKLRFENGNLAVEDVVHLEN